MPISPDPPGVPPGWGNLELAALGRIVFNFSGLNWCAERLLAGFISADASALLAVASMTTSKKLRELAAIANGTLAAGSLEAKLLKDWVTGTTLLNKERNSMLHSVWSGGKGPGCMTRVTPRVVKGEWRGESSQVDLDRLGALAEHMRECSEVAVALADVLMSCPQWYGQRLR
jgi:hypothetical protein